MIDFELTEGQRNVTEFLKWFAKYEIRPLAIEADRTHKVPDDFIEKIHKMGISQGMVPRQFGGAEGGIGEDKDKSGKPQVNRLSVLASEEIAWGDPAVIMNFPGPGLGGPPLKITGTQEQKEKYFSIFAPDRPPAWGAYALTEPGAGSDAANIQTTATLDGNHYILNGRKCFCTNGARASWVIVFATLDRNQGRSAHRAFIVEKGSPGFLVGKIEQKLGLRASETVELIFDQCRVPKENLLGGEEHDERLAGGGFKTAMKTFDQSRPMVGALALGIARAAYDEALAFAREAYMLGRPISRYHVLSEKLVEMERKIKAARLMCWHAAWMADEGIPNSKEASMAKAYAARISQDVTHWAIQIMGGFGMERERLVEKLFRDVKVYDIFEGTGQIQRLIISRRIFDGLHID